MKSFLTKLNRSALRIKPLLAAILFACAIVAPVGCKSTLQPGGAYAIEGQEPDKAFYIVDASFDLGMSTAQTAFKFERDNRDMLWRVSPNIKHTMDKARPVVFQVLKEYTEARAAYIANPTPAGLTVLQQLLTKVQALVAAVWTVPQLQTMIK